ncbi:unnamed protein product [Calicophoron daubneyi]|uniref:ZSWIM3 N-terminal domain-containing protein n=1 Tax=Calicophoron daubneyi TaxID=300641 RepID=A0AAV2TPT5_CALDB
MARDVGSAEIGSEQSNGVLVDITREFYKYFPSGATYESFEAVEKIIRLFEKSTGTSYVKRGSRRVLEHLKRSGELIPKRFIYKYVYFKCIHHKQDKTALVRGRRFKDWGCPSVFRVVYERGALHIHSNFVMQHNHPLISESMYPSSRTRFTPEELGVIYGLTRTCKSSAQIREYIRIRFGVEIAADHLNRLRQKAKMSDDSKFGLQPVQNPLPKENNMEVDGKSLRSTDEERSEEGESSGRTELSRRIEPASDFDGPEPHETSTSARLTEEDRSLIARRATSRLYGVLLSLEDEEFNQQVAFIEARTAWLERYGQTDTALNRMKSLASPEENNITRTSSS